MDYGYTTGDAFIDRVPALDLGADFFARPSNNTAATQLTDGELLRQFVALVQRSPEIGWRAGQMLGAAAFKTPVENPDPMPRAGIVAIEASFGDRGVSKAKRQRSDRLGARFDVKLQVSTTRDRGVSSASFHGRADFHEPQRALAKAVELSKPTKCRTPFADSYLALIREAVEGVATSQNMLVGFLHTKPETGGTHYHQGQLVLASRAGLEAHKLDDALVLLEGDKGLVVVRLPPTSLTTSTGKPLSGKFAMQSRGEVKEGAVGNSWATGVFEMRRS